MASTPYAHITANIIAELEKGNVIWQKPWKTGRPVNAISGKAYRGINPFLLLLGDKEYSDNRWVTYEQAKQLGGNVKQGEKCTWILFYLSVPKKEEKGAYRVARSYKVWNVEQCENLTKLAPLTPENAEVNADIVAEELWAKYADKPEVANGDKAYYIPAQDKIVMPKRETFISNAHFYAALFHEGAHSTGHATRLNRKGVTDSDGFGGTVYSFEELVAEFTSAFLCAEAGLDVPTRENTVAYLQSWIKALQSDVTMLSKAASEAQKVSDYMLGVSDNNPEKSEATEATEDELVTA